jgi:hypothetical protein
MGTNDSDWPLVKTVSWKQLLGEVYDPDSTCAARDFIFTEFTDKNIPKLKSRKIICC